MSRSKRAKAGKSNSATQPVYHKTNPKLRIASAPHGLWQLQRFGDAKGTRDFDPWFPVHRPTTFVAAEAQMNGAA